MTPHDHGSTVDGTAEPVLRLNGVTHRYGRRGAGAVIGPCDFSVATGTVTALVGRSGSGKSTMMNCAACLLRVTSGTVLYRGADITRLPESGRARLRRDEFGFVFQDGQLIPELPARENVALPLLLTGTRRRAALAKADEVLAKIGIPDLAGRRPSEMSGGQAQRVAIARALVANPRVVFADEPSGALDQATGHEVMQLLTATVARVGASLVMVTHDSAVARWCSRLVEIRDGLVHADRRLDVRVAR